MERQLASARKQLEEETLQKVDLENRVQSLKVCLPYVFTCCLFLRCCLCGMLFILLVCYEMFCVGQETITVSMCSETNLLYLHSSRLSLNYAFVFQVIY